MPSFKKPRKIIFRTFMVLFVLINVLACIHAYKFTHYNIQDTTIPKLPEQLSLTEKLNTLVLGVSLPKPINHNTPPQPYEEVKIGKLSAWWIKSDTTKPTLLLFHGYGSKKEGMLGRAMALHSMGYNTVLLDFSGSGDSPGNSTTIGYHEAAEVKQCYDYFAARIPEHKLWLLGSSMGAAAVMKCTHDYSIQPGGLILECPFGSLYEAVCGRMRAMGVPEFPMAGLLVFYGGLEHGFWAFNHSPTQYALSIKHPTLLLSGGKDERVSADEISSIYQNLSGPKKQIVYPESRHESYLNDYETEWKNDLDGFIKEHP